MILLDAAATTPVRRSALEAAWPYLTAEFGNPSSVHEPGLRAAQGLASARSAVAAFLGCRASEVIFTSGGTEGANLAIKGLALAAVLGSGRGPGSEPGPDADPGRGRHLVTTRIEHEAVLESVAYLARVHGFAVTYAQTDASGVVTPAALSAALRPDTSLVSIGYANNEVGTVQDVVALARVAHDVGALFHTDAVQAAASESLDVAALGVDALSFSGHKLGAPKGSGALFVRGGLPLEPLLHGGGQERGRRSGTENVAWAVALAAACAELAAERALPLPAALPLPRSSVAHSARPSDRAEVPTAGRASAPGSAVEHGAARADRAQLPTASRARDAFIAAVRASVPGARLTGHPSRRLPHHASFVVPGVNGETLLLELERRGVLVSSGSACAAGRTEPSHVLLALGFTPDEASTALRFTWTPDVTSEELQQAAAALADGARALLGTA